jgi:glycosyltransferase involved in cell wall biosynthesis
MKVTAAVTTYNRPKMVKKAINSVVSQSYCPLEIIVVEDGSQSKIQSWIEKKIDKKVEYVRHKKNKGLPAARNTAIERASGEYIGFLDDDDRWRPTRIEEQVHRLKKLSDSIRSRTGVIYAAAESIDEYGNSSINYPKNEGNLRKEIVKKGPRTTSSSFLFKISALKDVGRFDEKMPSSVDHDIWMSLAQGGYHAYTVDKPLVITNGNRGDRMTSDPNDRVEGVNMFLDKWRECLKDWMGKDEGKKFEIKYFSKVVSKLFADLILMGRLKEAAFVAKKILMYKEGNPYGAYMMARKAAGRVARLVKYKITNKVDNTFETG